MTIYLKFVKTQRLHRNRLLCFWSQTKKVGTLGFSKLKRVYSLMKDQRNKQLIRNQRLGLQVQANSTLTLRISLRISLSCLLRIKRASIAITHRCMQLMKISNHWTEWLDHQFLNGLRMNQQAMRFRTPMILKRLEFLRLLGTWLG